MLCVENTKRLYKVTILNLIPRMERLLSRLHFGHKSRFRTPWSWRLSSQHDKYMHVFLPKMFSAKIPNCSHTCNACMQESKTVETIGGCICRQQYCSYYKDWNGRMYFWRAFVTAAAKAKYQIQPSSERVEEQDSGR